jgi:transcriptional regulator GlxA family with amidase domain
VQTNATEIVKAIEVMGTVDEQGHLTLDVPLPIEKQTRVKVIVLISEAIEENHQLDAVASTVKSEVRESEAFRAYSISKKNRYEVYRRLADS